MPKKTWNLGEFLKTCLAHKWFGACVIFLYSSALLLGFLLCLLFTYAFHPSELFLADNIKLENQPWYAKALLANLIANGSVLTTSDLLEHFTTYYHSLIALLITLIVLLAGFITTNSYRSKSEQDELFRYHIDKFFKDFQRGLNNNGLEKTLNEYEELQAYLKERVMLITKDIDWSKEYEEFIFEQYSQYIEEQVFGHLDEVFLDKIYDYVEAKRKAE